MKKKLIWKGQLFRLVSLLLDQTSDPTETHAHITIKTNNATNGIYLFTVTACV